MRLDTTHVNKRKHDPKLGLLSFLFNHVNSTMPAGVNCRTTTAATAKGKEKCKKANTLPNKRVQSTGHAPAAKQKQVAAQPEKQEESSEEEQSGNEEEMMDEEKSYGEEQDEGLDTSDHNDQDELPLRIHIIPMKQKNAPEKVSKGMCNVV